MAYGVPNPLPLASRLRSIAREEGTRAALGRVANYGRIRLAQSTVGKAVGFGAAARSIYALGPTWQHLAKNGVFFGARPVEQRHLAVIAEASLPQCTRYRVEQMAGLARSCGMGFAAADQRDEAEALTALQMASHVMFYRLEPGARTWMYLYEARRLGLPVLYDLDDPLFSVPAITGSRVSLPEILTRHFADAAPGILAVMSACDAISVSTPALVEAVRSFLPRPVFLRRNYADQGMLEPVTGPAPVPGGPGLTLVLASGSDGRSGDLAVARPAIERFLAEDRGRRLILIGHGLDHHAGLAPAVVPQVTQVPFLDYPAYLAQLAEADAVLVPLADDPFNLCKSAVRVFDAASAGRPVIASPCGDLPAAVRHGETGWLAEDLSGWEAALADLAGRADRGRRLGHAAREALRQDWGDPAAARVTDAGLTEWLAA
ncbi:glycosyltransferase [Mangrovicoccus algicola]|uniref:Glycosyltransferase n=1 Tax=Mangrovicoccus algicola TaxID=2771008 RepID=A0A8J6Z6X3_9RHOB|nr:glycosyltransferase [Mangrovicoccus algicola]MBE3639009.1 glycosyltransferase [Mangrovicoccus algicola]